jgi:hypothetical protein
MKLEAVFNATEAMTMLLKQCHALQESITRQVIKRTLNATK